MRLLVCGGREWRDRGAVYRMLTVIHARRGIDCIIHGGAPGVDSFAGDWAREAGVSCDEYPAAWKVYRNAAGPIRNQLMLDVGKPDGVLAFPGGTGTADMVRRAEAAGIKVWKHGRVAR